MTLAEVLQRATVPPKEKQEELSDFVEFLLSHIEAKPATAEHTELNLQTPFFGMWADRPEMNDIALLTFKKCAKANGKVVVLLIDSQRRATAIKLSCSW
ncbi:MAG: hypothetical protein WC091_26445 [Sulfuricellaceae bacterium]